uniref:Complex I assembly factor TIMMDC1, mitochondrial n=1 Tax=Gossypium raimondii TaxID=29730 RepID=A0A0D2QCG7_GOSRA|nr:hypothetical protein B456_006G188800 [Gossypium raimondii]
MEGSEKHEETHSNRTERLAGTVNWGTATVIGVFAGMLYGVPGSLQWRARNVVLGSVLGAAICFPLGWIHLKLVEKANEGNMAAKSSGEIGEAKSGLGAAIDRLEENLNK